MEGWVLRDNGRSRLAVSEHRLNNERLLEYIHKMHSCFFFYLYLFTSPASSCRTVSAAVSSSGKHEAVQTRTTAAAAAATDRNMKQF